MKFPVWFLKVKSKAIAIGLRILSERLNGGFSIYFGKSLPKTQEAPEQYYATDGRVIPIYGNFR